MAGGGAWTIFSRRRSSAPLQPCITTDGATRGSAITRRSRSTYRSRSAFALVQRRPDPAAYKVLHPSDLFSAIPAIERLGVDSPLELAGVGPYCLLSTRKGHLAE